MKHRNRIVVGGATVLVLLGVLIVLGIIGPDPRPYTGVFAATALDTAASVAAMQTAGFTQEQIPALISLFEALDGASASQTRTELANLENRMQTRIANAQLETERRFTGIGIAVVGLLVAFFGVVPGRRDS